MVVSEVRIAAGVTGFDAGGGDGTRDRGEVVAVVVVVVGAVVV